MCACIQTFISQFSILNAPTHVDAHGAEPIVIVKLMMVDLRNRRHMSPTRLLKKLLCLNNAYHLYGLLHQHILRTLVSCVLFMASQPYIGIWSVKDTVGIY